MTATDALRQSHRLCKTIARSSARNFYYGFLLLPPERRRAMCALYAFMRHTDDIADEPGSNEAKRQALHAWRARTLDALAGMPAEAAYELHPVLPALAETANRYQVPPQYLTEVLDGVEMDLNPLVFPTFHELRQYCYRVASAVGLCCIHIWGYRSDNGRAEQMAEACGLALQLTNILRDVREDAERGRVYLPVEDLERFGVKPGELAGPEVNERVRALFEHTAERARGFYQEARPLEKLVDPVGRPVLRAMVGIYRTLLDEITRRNYDVLGQRVSVSPWRKAAITAFSLCGATR